MSFAPDRPADEDATAVRPVRPLDDEDRLFDALDAVRSQLSATQNALDGFLGQVSRATLGGPESTRTHTLEALGIRLVPPPRPRRLDD